jgi:hypothetical protein
MKKIVFTLLFTTSSLLSIAQIEYAGTDFWFNPSETINGPASYNRLRIIGDVATIGNVSVPGTGFSQDFCFNAGGVYVDIEMPYANHGLHNSNVVENSAIHITADNDILVVFFAVAGADSDYLIALPTSSLGTEYHVNLPKPIGWWSPSYVGITASENGTTVTIENTNDLGPWNWGTTSNLIPAGSTTIINLNQGESYRIEGGADNNTGPMSTLQISGTKITSDKAIFVSNSTSTNLPALWSTGAADQLRASMLPSSTWGNEYFTTPMTGLRDYYVQVLSNNNSNTITFDGTSIVTLNQGEIWDTIINGAHIISTTYPVGVIECSLGKDYDGATAGDPSSFNLLSTTHFQTEFSDFNQGYTSLNLIDSITYMMIVKTTAIPTTTINGSPISSSGFSPISSSSYSQGLITIPIGVYLNFTSSDVMMVYKNGVDLDYASYWQVARNMGRLNNPANSNFYPDTTICAIILPIELIFFTGVGYENYNTLHWETATEINNDYFQIEKSENGSTWKMMERLQGAGNSSVGLTYFTTDEEPYSITYYRLKQVDFNGKFSYSDLIAISQQAIVDVLDIYPNPTSAGFNFAFSNVETFSKKLTVTMYDAIGKIILTKSYNTHEEKSSLHFETMNVPNGLYHTVFSNGEKQISKRIIINHN